MNLLTAENISKSFNSDKILFDNISLGINEGDKIGLIGINGTGKSTLLKILAGEEEADSGKLTKGNAVRIAYLPQNPEFDDSESVISEVIKGKKAKNEFWDTEGEARSLLAKFEIEDVEAKVGTLSGGQKKRAALVRTLLDDAEILILDEPTNHLDTDMSEWLEDYLKKMKQALLIITHDRYFLDQVTNRIVELTHGKLYSYVGGYMKYLELKAEREEMEIATERKNAALYKKDFAWMMRGARARSTKQKAHIERFEELKNRDKIIVDKEIVVDSVSSRLGKQIIEIDNISKAYGNKVLFTDFTYIFRRIDRIGIIGKNGSGKSTLLKTILGQVKPDSGNIIIGQTAKIGYFSQDSGELNPNQTVIESAKDIAEYVQTQDGTVSASKMLERFLFEGAMQYTKIEKLSGGERRRLALLHTLISAPNILILDEPTNDLDITTLSILEDYLDSFDGVVITVSHDRYFLDRVANRIFSFEDGYIKFYEGGYSDYLEKAEPKTEEVKAEKKESDAKKDWKANKATKLKFTYAEQKEFETIDEDIEKLNAAIEKLDAEIAENASRYGKLGELMAEKEKLEAELEQKEERWLYLTELNEKIKAGGK